MADITELEKNKGMSLKSNISLHWLFTEFLYVCEFWT